jgi:5-methylcytosine-specific restriction endonuclease McrA
MKRCTKCGEIKPESEFYKAKGTRDGLRGDCKTCFAARAQVWYGANRDKVIARVKAWQAANPDRHRETQKAVRERRRPVNRDAHLRRKFGIGSPEYDAMLESQGGVCAICGRSPRKGSSLHVDHDHETGCVRGLLCFRCNGGLGQFAESPERLVEAAEYLDGALEPVDVRTELRVEAVSRARSLRATPV